MKMKIKKNNISHEDNLLPLVNIIFLLLIFFMLAGVIAKQKEMYGVDLASVVIDEYTDIYDVKYKIEDKHEISSDVVIYELFKITI